MIADLLVGNSINKMSRLVNCEMAKLIEQISFFEIVNWSIDDNLISIETHLTVICSVTRWLDCVFNIRPFAALNI